MKTTVDAPQASQERTRHPATLAALWTLPWRQRALLLPLMQRDVAGRYRGSVMGVVWSFVHPLLMLAVYTTVFGVFLQARWAGSSTQADFALTLFVGLIVFNAFAECVNRAPGLIIAHTNYVKKVIFPLDILPVMVVGAALFHAGMSLLVWMAFALVLHGTLPWTLLLVPLVWVPLVLTLLGLTWFVSALGVYVRDVAQMMGILTTMVMFLSPIFYATHTVPPAFQWLMWCNPLTMIIEQSRHVMLHGVLPDVAGLGLATGLSLGLAWLGFLWFQKTREGFADVL